MASNVHALLCNRDGLNRLRHVGREGPRPTSATVLLAAPCVALMAALGALAAHASRGLMLAMLVWMVVSIAVAASDGDLEPLRYVLPSAMKHHAISDRAVDLGPLAAFQLAYTVVALAAGFAVFRRRDV
jgi:hypothetical protein